MAGGDPVFHRRVSGEMYEWLLREQKRRGADSILLQVKEAVRIPQHQKQPEGKICINRDFY